MKKLFIIKKIFYFYKIKYEKPIIAKKVIAMKNLKKLLLICALQLNFIHTSENQSINDLSPAIEQMDIQNDIDEIIERVTTITNADPYLSITPGDIQFISTHANEILENGNSLLHIAAKYDNRNITRIALQFNSINNQNNCGNTPLHLAMQTNAETANILMTAGANHLIENNAGQTALKIAQNYAFRTRKSGPCSIS